MPVLTSMQDASWQEPRNAMLSNGPEMSGNRNRSRSQDDAMVGYYYQRPQMDVTQQYGNKRWAVGDDSVLEQARSVSELEREFQSMGFTEPRDLGQNTKKLWDDDKGGGGDSGKVMFAGGPWMAREADGWPPQTAEHVLSHPINVAQRRPGSFPGSDPSSVLSPRSSETGALGVNMAEYVLGGSPVGKEMDVRLHGMKRFGPGGDADEHKKTLEKGLKSAPPYQSCDSSKPDIKKLASNGIVQNGLEEDVIYRPHGSQQTSPIDGDIISTVQLPPPQLLIDKSQKLTSLQGKPEDGLIVGEIPPQSLPPSSGFHLDAPHFEPVGIDPFQGAEYGSNLMPSMDSPNFDYNQQLLQRQQQQQQSQQQAPIALLTQQQYALAAQQQQQQQQQQLGPAVVPQYYSVQAPWGLYPVTGLVQQQTPGQQTPQGTPLSAQQQQLLRAQAGNRPLTPSQSSDGLGTPTAGGAAPYQILAPAYYDQNGQLVMGNGRGIGTPLRLVSPAPILVNAATNGQQGFTPTSGLYTPVTNSLFTNTLSLNQQQTGSMAAGFNNTNLGSSGTPGAIGSGLSTHRRDSLGATLDFKRPQQLPQLGQYYGTLGTTSTSPAGPMGLVQPGQSLTPPSSLSGSTGNLNLAGLGGSRLYSVAPGAEAKYRNGSFSGNNGLFNASLFNPRFLAKSANMTKEVSGRSRLLEDFRNSRIPNLQLKDLVNHVVEFSQDQHGSRFIQQKLERASASEKAMVFKEILESAYSLMTDVFGNYVIQKFFEFGTPDQKQTLAQRVRGHVLPLALQMYGCRVIQKALESIPSDMQVEIVTELDKHVLKCVKDQNGNHVVQKCIECVEPKHLQFIIDAFKGQVFTLSTHPYGCRVIQRILEHCTLEQTAPILEELHQHTERLVQDQYGNYVIQHVLEHGRPEDKSLIVSGLRGKVLALSQHKFASNVVEKCVSHSTRAERAMLIDEVCAMADGALYTMMKDQFANYVVQKMIDIAEQPQRKMLIHKIRPHFGTLRKYTYGKHILAKLEKYYMKTSTDLGPIGMPPNGTLQ